MAGAFPDLVARATERFGSILLARVLRDLLDDGISIRDLRGILDGMLFAWGTTTADGRKKIIFPTKAGILLPSPERRSAEQLSWAELVECARIVLRRYISHKYTRGQNTLVVLLLEPALEDLIHGWRLSPASDEEKNEVIGAVEDEVLTSTNPDTLVILTSVETRRPTRQLLRYAFPALPVVSYQELSPDINIQPIARIGLRSRTPPHNSTRIDSAN
jgi:type III secretion protein V